MGSIKGEIGYHGLADWFVKTFTPEEQRGMEELYRAKYDDPRVTLTRGDIGAAPDTSRLLSFLTDLAKEFQDFPHIAQRILRRGLDSIGSTTDIVQVHFYYGTIIEIAYHERDSLPGALDTAIRFCERQISIAPAVMASMKHRHEETEQRRMERHRIMGKLRNWKPCQFPATSHRGFEQLCIIREKQKNYAEVIRLAQMARQQGWNGDWDKRVARCQKKL